MHRAANPSLIKLLVKASNWWTMLREGELDIEQLAARESMQASYVTCVARLAFLSPAVVAAIIKGNVRGYIDCAALAATDSIPACEQA